MNEKYRKAFKEVLHYLNGIRPAAVAKIPSEMIELFKKNSDSDYECDFDYRLPLKELELLEETRGLIGMLCLEYWCETEAQREELLRVFQRNENQYKLEQYQRILEEEND